jgi:serine/threonine protein kinase/tetratricopeptide (TPR) repeat protein
VVEAKYLEWRGVLPRARVPKVSPPSSFELSSASNAGYIKDVTEQRSGDVAEATLREHGTGQKLFGRYTLIKILGRGGMGVVWLARDEELEREVALKFLPDVIIHDRAVLNELKRETRRSLELTHKNIVRIYDFVHDERSGCISMEHIDGETLSNLRAQKERKVFEPNEIGPWTSQLCDALDYAHNHAKIIHRDLKPANLMVNQRGDLKVSDFGIARSLGDTVSRLTMEQGRSGTLVYMSPQQLDGERGTHLDDIYSLGATVYELLTSKPPFYVGNIDRQIREKIPPSMTERRKEFEIEAEPIPAVWEECVAACLAKDPGRRPQSVSEIARQLQMLSPEARPPPVRPFFQRKKKRVLVLAVASLCLLAPGAWYFGVFKRGEKQAGQTAVAHLAAPKSTSASTAVPEKSIAVLPFENLSEEKANAFFADGVQDEILTDLARIADLKVISRTSVMQYKSGVVRNLREIGQQLGVANVVEGTVQRSGNRVRVNAQLIDARTDKQLWGQVYDRDLADVFAIQSEIARTIADQLQAKLSPGEEKAVERPPTGDLAAFDLYTRAKNILAAPDPTHAELLQAVDLLSQAVARDPSFFDAYCQLAYAHDDIYNEYVDHTSGRLALAEAAIQAAARLRPDAGETHLARAQNLYWGYWDYDRALAELEIARRTLPNDFRIPQMTAHIRKRQGHWEEAIRTLEHAIELNPRNLQLRAEIAIIYTVLRRYADLKSALASTLAVFPNDLNTRIWPAYAEFQEKADTRPLHQMLDLMRATNPAGTRDIAEWWLACALAERDATAAKNALDAHSDDPIVLGMEVFLSRSFVEGLIALIKKDEGKARSAFVAARAEQEKVVEAQPNDSQALGLLGLIDAYLGRKEEALREGRRAIELVRAEKDVRNEIVRVANLAMIAAWVGDKDLAFEQLESIIRLPSPLSYGGLKLFPWWDPLRDDPRFEKIVEESKQPVALKEKQ